jgi:hypothetical protein
VSELSFRELFPELNENQIKMLKRYMLELVGDHEELRQKIEDL